MTMWHVGGKLLCECRMSYVAIACRPQMFRCKSMSSCPIVCGEELLRFRAQIERKLRKSLRLRVRIDKNTCGGLPGTKKMEYYRHALGMPNRGCVARARLGKNPYMQQTLLARRHRPFRNASR